MDLGDLLGTVMKESLGLRSKRKDSATSWLLKGVRKRPGLALGAAVGAAGLAYGIWERSQRGSAAGSAAPPAMPPLPPDGMAGSSRPAATPPPLPAMAPEVASDDAALRQVRLVLAAAQADGAVTAAEMQRVMDAAREVGAESEVLRDLATPRDVEAIVSGVTELPERHDLYALAFAIVRCDESVSDAERRWLERLARALSLSAHEVHVLEAEVTAGIDAS